MVWTKNLILEWSLAARVVLGRLLISRCRFVRAAIIGNDWAAEGERKYRLPLVPLEGAQLSFRYLFGPFKAEVLALVLLFLGADGTVFYTISLQFPTFQREKRHVLLRDHLQVLSLNGHFHESCLDYGLVAAKVPHAGLLELTIRAHVQID